MMLRKTGFASLLLVAALTAGCGGGAAPSPTDPAAAREVLSRALDAWKSGAAKDSLAKGTPSVLVNDPDWERGAKLVDFKLDGEGKPLGAGIQWNVPLTLAAKGKTRAKKAVYVVNVADEVVAVSRQDMDF